MALKLVPPAPKPERSKRRQVLDRLAETAPAGFLACKRCGSMEFIQTLHGVAQGKPKSGTKALICLHCFVHRGERVGIT